MTAVLLAFTGSAAAFNVSFTQVTHPINYNNQTHAANLTIEAYNETVNVTDIYTNTISFDVSFTPATPVINASCSGDANCSVEHETVSVYTGATNNFDPRTYNGTIVMAFENSDVHEQDISFTVPAVEQWNVTNASFIDSMSVGESRIIGNLTVENTGNVDTDLDVSVGGGLAPYLDFDDSPTSYPNIDNDLRFEAVVPDSAAFGNYTSNVTVSSDKANSSVSFNMTLRDNIDPEIKQSVFSDFMASFQDDAFIVEAADNFAVGSVNATVFYEETEQHGNETVTVNRTLENLSFEAVPQSDLWEATLDNQNRSGTYYVNGTVRDKSNNTVRFVDSFTVDPLDVVDISTQAELPLKNTGETFKYQIGRLDRPRSVNVTLEFFEYSLTNTSQEWDVGIETGSGTQYFEKEGGVVRVTEPGPISLVIYGEEPTIFTGRLSLSAVEPHVSIPPVSFNGELVDYTVPEQDQFTVFDTVFDCPPERSSRINESGWRCSFFVPATDVPPDQSLNESIRIGVPNEMVQDHRAAYQTRIKSLKGDKSLWQLLALAGLLVGGFVGTAGVFAYKYGPELYYAKMKETRGD